MGFFGHRSSALDFFPIIFSPFFLFSLSDIAGFILLHLNFFDTTLPTDQRRSEFCQKAILVFRTFSFVCIGILRAILIGLNGV